MRNQYKITIGYQHFLFDLDKCDIEDASIGDMVNVLNRLTMLEQRSYQMPEAVRSGYDGSFVAGPLRMTVQQLTNERLYTPEEWNVIVKHETYAVEQAQTAATMAAKDAEPF